MVAEQNSTVDGVLCVLKVGRFRQNRNGIQSPAARLSATILIQKSIHKCEKVFSRGLDCCICRSCALDLILWCEIDHCRLSQIAEDYVGLHEIVAEYFSVSIDAAKDSKWHVDLPHSLHFFVARRPLHTYD